jgi:hypothetical protein
LVLIVKGEGKTERVRERGERDEWEQRREKVGV